MIANFIYSLEPVWLGIFILLCTLTASLACILFCRLFIRLRNSEDTDFKVETYSDAFGVAFAILLGLIIINSWNSYDGTEVLVKNEVNYLDDMYRLSKYLKKEDKTEIKEDLHNYVEYVVKEEWPNLIKGGQLDQASNYLYSIFDILYMQDVNTLKQQLYISEMQKIGKKLIETRRLRNYNAASSMTPFMWIIVIACNLITFFVLALGSLGSLKLHIILQIMYAIGIGLMILLVVVLDRPFYYGAYYDGGISSKLFKTLQQSWVAAESL